MISSLTVKAPEVRQAHRDLPRLLLVPGQELVKTEDA